MEPFEEQRLSGKPAITSKINEDNQGWSMGSTVRIGEREFRIVGDYGMSLSRGAGQRILWASRQIVGHTKADEQMVGLPDPARLIDIFRQAVDTGCHVFIEEIEVAYVPEYIQGEEMLAPRTAIYARLTQGGYHHWILHIM